MSKEIIKYQEGIPVRLSKILGERGFCLHQEGSLQNAARALFYKDILYFYEIGSSMNYYSNPTHE